LDLNRPKRIDFNWQECATTAVEDCIVRGNIAVLSGSELIEEPHEPWAGRFYKAVAQPPAVTKYLGSGFLSAAFMSPSVEGAWMPIPPKAIAISVGVSAVQPIEWVFVSASSLWRVLKNRFQEAEVGSFLDGDAIASRPEGVDVCHPGYQCLQTTEGKRVSCRFSGRLDHDVRPHPMSQPVFDFCREYVLDERNQLCLSLDPGQTAMIANARFCNARRAGQVPNETIVWLMPKSPNDGFDGFLEDVFDDAI
jgi:hypothetical protein